MLKKSIYYLIFFSFFIGLSFINSSYAQTEITVNATTPCFLNYTASYNMLENCNADDDYIAWLLLGWTWITGGYFPMIIVSLIIGLVYVHYREAIYTIYIGIIFLPISFMFFPDIFLSWAVIMAFVGVGVLIWWAIIKNVDR